MELAKERPSNARLLDYLKEGESVDDAITCITRNRPLKNADEAGPVAESLCDILAFMQFSVGRDTELIPQTDTMFSVLRGMEHVTEIASLLSLRLDQFLTLHRLEEE